MFIQNSDPRVYRDPEAQERERLTLLVEKMGDVVDENGVVHAHDILSMKVREQVKKDQRKTLTYIDNDDDEFELLFKYFETLKTY